MTDAILIFTFNPVQSFIAEARRAADLYAGSRILIELAQAAVRSIRDNNGGELIYPAALTGDAPNKIVARVPWDKAEQIGKSAKQAVLNRWSGIVTEARRGMEQRHFPIDDPAWEAIWGRQTKQDYFWGVFWAVARMPSEADYPQAYREASRALDAVKRSRIFVPADDERGLKDSLSGSREALHTANEDAKKCWMSIAEKVEAPEIRSEGRERLDAFGAIKRFGKIAPKGMFFSTSTVAAEDFLIEAKRKAGADLAKCKEAVTALLGGRPNRVRNDEQWPYDGDLFFLETLTAERLKDSYRIKKADEAQLDAARRALRALHKPVNFAPSPYYAIIVLDGDNMGQWISDCKDEAGHRAVSEKLAAFADKVNGIVPDGFRVYNGGDDVLALAPLAQALPMAKQLAGGFNAMTKGRTASAGIAIAHHLYPLEAALAAARAAEKHAKNALNKAKAAVCVRALKRGGETVEVYSQWETLGDTFESLVKMFRDDSLSSRFAYDVIRSAYALNEADNKFEAELKRLLTRHRNDKHPNPPDSVEWARKLRMWAEKLPEKSEELGRWLALARFVARGGRE